MKTYRDYCNGKLYQYFYDRNIKLWTIHEIDNEGNQLSREGDYYNDKKQMLKYYNFKFTLYES